MKPPLFFVTSALAFIALVLSIIVFWQGHSLSALQTSVGKEQMDVQTTLQEKQQSINVGNQSAQVGTNILKDIASAAMDAKTGTIRNEKLKALLERNGVNIQFNQPAASSPSPSPSHEH